MTAPTVQPAWAWTDRSYSGLSNAPCVSAERCSAPVTGSGAPRRQDSASSNARSAAPNRSASGRLWTQGWSASTAFTTSSSTVVPISAVPPPAGAASYAVAGIPGKPPLEEVFPSAGTGPRGALSAARGWLHRHWNETSMIEWTLKKIIGTKNERELKRAWPKVARINAFEPRMRELSDEAFPTETVRLKQEVANGRPLDDVLFEAFALTREAARRTIGQRHFDVQLIGGMFLHQGCIAEMRTGEGKTITATLPSYLNALSGRGVHVVTVNDYLARRDAEWMGRIHHSLGLTVGCIVHDLDDGERQTAYRSDITYGQNNEFGFDYLRDNMKFRLSDYVQRELNFAIVDEVDSILIDEARTPLIISGPTEENTDEYYRIDRVIPGLLPDQDYALDEKTRSVNLTDEGVEKVQKRLGISNLYDPSEVETLHHVEQALRSHTLYRRDRDYVVKDGEVIIVDEFTGRLMPGRRWSDGLHQAVEAKEGVKIENETQTLATISFQNYFRMYSKLSGMTGTADTEAESSPRSTTSTSGWSPPTGR